MKNLKLAILIFVGLSLITSCEDEYLERFPLDQPSNLNFYSTEAELDLAVNAIYEMMYWQSNSPAWLLFDCATDLGWNRSERGGGLKALGNGSYTPDQLLFTFLWERSYTAIARANTLLKYMPERAVANGAISEAQASEYAAQARFLRGLFYMYLTSYWGDVPLVTEVLSLEDAELPRNAKSSVVDQIYQDLDFAAQHLPDQWDANNEGRVTQGAALALKARVALFNEDYEIAAEAAQAVMNAGTYQLHPSYPELFTYAGETSPEIIFAIRYLQGVQTHAGPQNQLTRLTGGWSNPSASQFLVDSYECTDGLPIDESPLYDPANPFQNRDPRLDYTIIRSGAVFGGYVYQSHIDSTMTTNVITNERVVNQDSRGVQQYASFTGYAFRKYLDPIDINQRRESDLNAIVMRYAEVLLNYAEAKIEMNDIDQSVYDAINAVRQRSTVEMPPVTPGKSQSEMRTLVRRERKVEFAFEGLRLFDINRWRIAEYVMPGKLIGRPRAGYATLPIPTIDEYGHPQYTDEDLYTFTEIRLFDPNRDYLFPIPQKELDVNQELEQNPYY
ncbi:MAG: RagB/SusD family nutrient uptake outer membrane protein [Bacteroidota bacterium]